MIKKKIDYLYIFLIIFSILSFFYGYSIRENSAGGGNIDFKNTWSNQKVFNDHGLIDALKNTKTSEIYPYISSHLPTSFILNKILNPFSGDKEKFLDSIFIINIFLPILFFIVLKNRYARKNIYLLGCFASILYLSPYFRTSSYWASLENYGLFSFVISIYFFQKYLVSLETKNNSYKYFNISFISLFSCLCVYFDQKLLFIPIIYMFYILKYETDIYKKIYYLIINFFLSIPVLSIIFYWGGVMAPLDAAKRNVGNLNFEQIGYTFSIILIYFVPYIIRNFKILIIENLNKRLILLSTIFLMIYFMYLIFFPQNYHSWEYFGKGWLHKISFFFNDTLVRKLFVYFFFYISIISILLISRKNLVILFYVFFMSFISLITLPIFQEYFDPLTFLILSIFFYKQKELDDKLTLINYSFSLLFLFTLNIYYL
tara:strand:- start:385 stop:1671 length:1287 start_codon:yes stop_codon:yes gene_type:complete